MRLHVPPLTRPVLTALLEQEHFPFPAHPRHDEIRAALGSFRTLALAHAPIPASPEFPHAGALAAASKMPTMTFQACMDVLRSSDPDAIVPALRDLGRLAVSRDLAGLKACIAQVGSKRILGHADFTVRAAAVAALSSLLKADDVATRQGT
jgi:hypothetical protein